MRWWRPLLLASLIGTGIGAAAAEPMTFRPGGNDTRLCADCQWIQASGEITADTPEQFRAYLNEESNYAAQRVRLDSSGGDLVGGMKLGELFRELEIATEVGADTPDPEGRLWAPWRATKRSGGACASACAYAFLGGVQRRLDADSQLGFHRFYFEAELIRPTAELFSGEDLSETQRMLAGLVLYVTTMGVDSRLVSLATQAGPTEVHWITPAEAAEYDIVHDAHAWTPWRLETYRGGLIAISETNDEQLRMIASCGRLNGPEVLLINPDSTEWSEGFGIDEWFRQCTDDITNTVFGKQVPPGMAEVRELENGGAFLRLRLPDANPPFTTPEILGPETAPFNACLSLNYQGSKENFEEAVTMAFRNCFAD